MNYLREAEIQALLRAAKGRKSEVIIRVLLNTGIRTGECAGLDVEDVDHERRVLHILDSKKHRAFTVPIDFQSLKLIRKHVGSRKEGPLFLSLSTGERLTDQGIYSAVRKTARRAGINIGRPVTPRTLRHTFANMWDDQHGSIRRLQKILRHDHLSSTQAYLDTDDEQVLREYARIFERREFEPRIPEKRTRSRTYIS